MSFFFLDIRVRNPAIIWNRRFLAYYIVAYMRVHIRTHIAIKLFSSPWHFQGSFICTRVKLYNFNHGARLAACARKRTKRLFKYGLLARSTRTRTHQTLRFL